ncbi:MAG: DNA mismatch repair endonuclease MutL [Candidatus Asgardarchaeum sp.]
MGRIIKLSEDVIKKIAAGEVVERPASVVKELIENSIDASATAIYIDVLGGGLKQIKVVDNGIGMTKEDALLSFERYTTSKIKSTEDLYRITTLGFRGEALASIAAVSRLTIITRTKEEKIGTKVIVEGGVLKKVEPIGCKPGTTIIVKDLFFNVPVRRKFLKSPSTEFGHIADIVTKYSFLYLNIHFKLTHNGRLIISSPASKSLIDKVSFIYGNDIALNMINVDEKKERLRVWGVTSKPSISRATRDYIITFVNGRYVANALLYRAIDEAYFTLLPEGRYPITIINIEIPPEDVDVNIHPTKREIRFHNPDIVYNIVKDGIRNCLLREKLQPEISEKQLHAVEAQQIEVRKVKSPKEIIDTTITEKGVQTTLVDIHDFLKVEHMPKFETPWRILGQVANVFIIATDDDSIYIIDQHAAHERIQFEKFCKEYKENRIKSQELLEPYMIDVAPQKIELLKNLLDYLKTFGIDIDYFGGNTFIVRSVPVIIKEIATKDEIKDFIDELLSLKDVKVGRLPKEKEIISMIACKSAIKAGEPLTMEKMRKIIYELFSLTENPFTCPHGRPTIIEIKKKKLYRLFKRS